MPDQRNPADAHGPDRTDEDIDVAVLHYMIWNGPWPMTVQELAREMGEDITTTTDAIARLTRAGLVHHLDHFVFPTRIACRANDLRIGSV